MLTISADGVLYFNGFPVGMLDTRILSSPKFEVIRNYSDASVMALAQLMAQHIGNKLYNKLPNKEHIFILKQAGMLKDSE